MKFQFMNGCVKTTWWLRIKSIKWWVLRFDDSAKKGCNLSGLTKLYCRAITAVGIAGVAVWAIVRQRNAKAFKTALAASQSPFKIWHCLFILERIGPFTYRRPPGVHFPFWKLIPNRYSVITSAQYKQFLQREQRI